MISARSLAVAAFALTLAGSAAAKDAGNFVVQLGTDTTAVESYSSTDDRIEITSIGRSPRVLQRRYVYEFQKGVMTHFSMVVTPPGTTTPTQTIDAVVDGDTLRTDIVAGANTQKLRVALPHGTLLAAASSPWALYEHMSLKLAKSKSDTVGSPFYFVGAGNSGWLTLRKLGRDSVRIATDRGDVYHARVDKTGHFLGLRPIAGTQKFGLTREASLDVAAYENAFAEREKQGAGIGTLSPRDSVKATVGGAALLIDYGRPSKRGRVIFGQVVPYGEVWRTGANAATQFRTDKDLVFGGTTVPAGFYTLWTMPTAQGWKLIVNSETGQWGTAHKTDRDLYTIDMQTTQLAEPVERFTMGIDPSADGGVLHLKWDTLRASVNFTVKP